MDRIAAGGSGFQRGCGNPYGAGLDSSGRPGPSEETVLAAARYQGRRLAEVAARLTAAPTPHGKEPAMAA